MRRRRVAASALHHRLVACAIGITSGLGALAAACGSDDPPRVVPVPAEAGPDAVAPPDADIPSDDAGPLSVVDEPDTPCAVTAAGSASLLAPSSDVTTPTGLALLGQRRAALVGNGVATFAADGSSFSPPVGAPTYGSLSANTTAFVAARVVSSGLEVVRFAPEGALLGATPIDPEAPSGYAIGGAGTDVLALWTTGRGVVFARAVSAGGTASTPFFVRGMEESQELAASIAPADADGTLGIAMSGHDGDGDYRVAFARATTRGLVERSTTLTAGRTYARVVQLARTATGYALLVDLGREAHLALLDERGRLRAPIRRLVGTIRGFGLAVSTAKSRIAVVTRHRDKDAVPADPGDAGTDLDGSTDASPSGAPSDAVALRVFDLDGVAKGAFRCLNAPQPTAGDFGASIVEDDAGWAIVHTTPSRAVVLTRLPSDD